MPTSFTMTARDMVTQAMREIGVIASGEQPTSDEISDGILRLNSLLKSYAAKGLNMWRDSEATIDFAPGESSKVVPEAVAVMDARVVVNGYERMLAPFEVEEYAGLPNKGALGAPVSFTVNRTVGGVSLQLWPVPNAATTIRYRYARITTDVVEPSDPVDVPQMFQEAIWKALAVRLAPTFGKARTDPQTIQLVAMQAAELERDMLDFDRPATYHLGSDLPGYP